MNSMYLGCWMEADSESVKHVRDYEYFLLKVSESVG